MIFDFIKYTHPTWYYNLPPKTDYQYFPTEEELKAANINYELDTNYTSVLAAQRDLAWRMFQQGWVGADGKGIDIWSKDKLPIEDEYHFLRKYFSPVWSWYVLGLRIVGFKNPVREIRAFISNRHFPRSSYNFIEATKQVEKIDRASIEEQSLVSVIIPTLNRYEYLKDVLADLERQTYSNFEVIVVDQSEPFDAKFYENWKLNMRVEHQQEKALWLARNKAIKMSQGDLVLLYDDDSRVSPDWIVQHLRCLHYFNADISSGISISTVGGRVPEGYRYFKSSEQLDTGNVLVKKHVFREIGLFDRQFEKQRLGDGEFGLRAYLAGFRNINNPLAERLHLKAEGGGLRQMGHWDEFRPKKLFAPRPIPSVLYFFRKYFGNTIAMRAVLNGLPKSVVPYKFKGDKKKLILGYFIAILFTPFLLAQVLSSWRRSDNMLREGDKIEKL